MAPILRENLYLNNHASRPAHLMTPPASASENPSDEWEDDLSDEGDPSSKDGGVVYKEYCQVYHIGTECPLSGPKFSNAETGMGVTSRP